MVNFPMHAGPWWRWSCLFGSFQYVPMDSWTRRTMILVPRRKLSRLQCLSSIFCKTLCSISLLTILANTVSFPLGWTADREDMCVSIHMNIQSFWLFVHHCLLRCNIHVAPERILASFHLTAVIRLITAHVNWDHSTQLKICFLFIHHNREFFNSGIQTYVQGALTLVPPGKNKRLKTPTMGLGLLDSKALWGEEHRKLMISKRRQCCWEKERYF